MTEAAAPPGFDRPPPQAIADEQAVLGGMMLSREAIADVVKLVKADDFYRPAHQVVFDAILAQYGEGDPTDALAISKRLSKEGTLQRIGGGPYLHTLLAAPPTAANAAYYAENVAEKAQLRRTVEAGLRTVQLAYGADSDRVDVGTAADVVDQVQAAVYELSGHRESDDYSVMEELVGPAFDWIGDVQEGKRPEGAVMTGFADLDAKTNGIQPGQFVVIGARPAIGKSTFAIDIVRSCSIDQALPSLFFSLEMPKRDLAIRILSAEATAPLHSLRTAVPKLTDDQWIRLARSMAEVGAAPIYIDDNADITMAEIIAKTRRLQQQVGRLGLIVVDYLQLMTSATRAENRQQEVGAFSRQLKVLAKKLHIPVIAVSQLNRGPENRADKKPTLADLRESGQIEQDADMVVLLHRPDQYDPEDRPGEADLILAKNRNGENGIVPVTAQLHYSRFRDMYRGH